MKVETVQASWRKQVKVFFFGAWLVRWCTYGKHWGWVGNSGEDAFKFISAPGWICAGCRVHQEAIQIAPVACLRRH